MSLFKAQPQRRKYSLRYSKSTYTKRFQRIFGTVKFEARKRFENSFVLLNSTLQVARRLWVARILLLFRIVTSDSTRAYAFVLLENMKYMRSPESPGKALARVCPSCGADDEHGHPQISQTAKRERIWSAVGQLHGIKRFDSFQKGDGVVYNNYRLQPFTKELHRPQHWFYID